MNCNNPLVLYNSLHLRYKNTYMKRFTTALTIVTASLLMAQCTAKKATSSAAAKEMTPEEAVADVKKNFTEAQMEEGRVVFQANCGKCHNIHEPETRTVQKWERVLPRMSKKANLEEEQAAKVRAYVLAHAKLS